jgi:hypothetical protein
MTWGYDEIAAAMRQGWEDDARREAAAADLRLAKGLFRLCIVTVWIFSIYVWSVVY